MNTPSNLPFAISASYLGPVFSLAENLSRSAQNLIYARNGTGKSFLSRAFRYFDLRGQGDNIDTAAQLLVSEESPSGKGTFQFSRGSKIMGRLTLQQLNNNVSAAINDTIFHVFSEDFVQEELRQKSYKISDDIESEISIDSDNIILRDAQRDLEHMQDQERILTETLYTLFSNQQRVQLNEKAKVHSQLREYKAINFQKHVLSLAVSPSSPKKSFVQILMDLDRLRTLPDVPNFPKEIRLLSIDEVDLYSLRVSLEKTTSPSSVADEIKLKIEAHRDFHKAGVQMIHENDLSNCPFCEQDIRGHDVSIIIDAYVAYFADEEERHRNQLRGFYASLNSLDREIVEVERDITVQKARYDELKQFIPSKQGVDFGEGKNEIAKVRELISDIKAIISHKASDLSTVYPMADGLLLEAVNAANEVILSNNSKTIDLNTSVKKSDGERRALQREACVIFVQEFALRHWQDVQEIVQARRKIGEKRDEVTQLESASPSARTRERVAETFEMLLQGFFSGKYVFDRRSFTLRRGDREMSRGAHRTLSDGEKTAIAFCYFVASMHRKVKANRDYEKLFLVFDDPVTSMSYDYVFAIAETLRNMSVSRQGEISVNPSVIDGNTRRRPDLLILTHSSYFFNIAITNGVVRPEAAFTLYPQGEAHRIAPMSKYMAPFQQQMRHIAEVARGGEADHGTGNAIRSVLEAVGRFCRPDKCGSLAEFVRFLAAGDGFTLRSVLMNSLSHGSYYQETPAPDDLRVACQETLCVVRKYAAGQVEVIGPSSGS